ELGECLAAGDVMRPSADAGRRPARMPEMAHMELPLRDLPALQHPQHGGEGRDLHLAEPEFICGLEVLCKHSAPRIVPRMSRPRMAIRAPIAGGNSSRPGSMARPVQIFLTVDRKATLQGSDIGKFPRMAPYPHPRVAWHDRRDKPAAPRIPFTSLGRGSGFRPGQNQPTIAPARSDVRPTRSKSIASRGACACGLVALA